MTKHVKYCAVCGDEFLSRSPKAIYCSARCLGKRRNPEERLSQARARYWANHEKELARSRAKNVRARLSINKHCEVCGEEISRRSIYCSKKCAAISRRRRKRADPKSRRRQADPNNREKNLEQNRIYHRVERKKISARKKAHYRANLERERARHRAFDEANREWRQTRGRARYQDMKIAYEEFFAAGLMPIISREGKTSKEYKAEKQLHRRVALGMLKEWQKEKKAKQTTPPTIIQGE